MIEQEPEFSEEERGQIAFCARSFAELGADSITALTGMKIRFCMYCLKVIDSVPNDSARLDLTTALLHEAQVINEVLRQAKAITQLTGTDELSQLDRYAQEAGLGSIFDENSPIGAQAKKYLQG